MVLSLSLLLVVVVLLLALLVVLVDVLGMVVAVRWGGESVGRANKRKAAGDTEQQSMSESYCRTQTSSMLAASSVQAPIAAATEPATAAVSLH
jgi:UPF0716 family protein affecting phage T7 exclusion